MQIDRRPPDASRAKGFTLVEVLVVIVVVVILLGLLVPAVQGAREAARRTQCKGNLRQVALACRNFASRHGILPYPGWDAGYVGDPDLRVDANRNGGWLYLILPFVERTNLHEMGAGLTGAAKSAEFGKRAMIAVPLYTCPGRGSPLFKGFKAFANATIPAGSSIARTDYAGCMSAAVWDGNGALDTKRYGLSRELAEITDGESNVFLCGERFLGPDQYTPSTNVVSCNNAGWSVGFEGDIVSSVLNSSGTPNPPTRDTLGVTKCWTNPMTGVSDERYGGAFGGPHSAVIMAMCDGAVRGVDFGVDPLLFKQIGTINDGGNLDELP